MNMPSRSLAPVVLCLGITLSLFPPARAQNAPATSTAPTTQPPRKVVIPPGFKTLTVGGRTIVCEPVDEGWITTALLKIPSSTRPATLPATLLQRLSDQRAELLKRIPTDLALSDSEPVAKMYDQELTEPIRKLDEYRPHVFYLVTSPDRIVELMRQGWHDPHFYYNRAADAVSFSPAGSLPIDRPEDQAIFPVSFKPKDELEKRQDELKKGIDAIESTIRSSIDVRARTHIGATFALMVQQLAMAPLNLHPDQNWFAVGAATYLSVLYTADVTGDDRAKLLDLFTHDTRANPLKTTAIDLLHPQDPKQMRPRAIPLYFDAFRRKSTRVIRALVEKAGENAIPKSIVAIREKKPADGAALVSVIKTAAGVDLSGTTGREE